MFKRTFIVKVPFILLAILLFASCSHKTTGVIVEVVDEENLYIAEVSLDEYKEIKDQETNELIEDNISLINLHYISDKTFKKGDYVDVWIDGNISTSYPEQATAKKIKVKK